MQDEPRGGTRGTWFILSLCLLISFVGITNRGAWGSDEARVSAIALEMEGSGDFVIPRLAGEPFVEKPPLVFAAAAGLVRAFGAWLGVVGSVRVVSILSGLGTLLVVYRLALRLRGRAVALWSVLLLATMVGFVSETHTARVDMTLAFFVTAGIWCLTEAYVGQRPAFLLAAGLFIAGTFLSKGAVGVVLCGAAWMSLVPPWFLQVRALPVRPVGTWVLTHLGAVGVFTFVALAWILPFYRVATPELWDHWFWDNQVGRFTGDAEELGHMHGFQPHFYPAALAGITAPWTPLVLIWFWRLGSRFRKERTISQSDLLLLGWGVGTMALLTVSATKRNVYLVPAIAPFAVQCAEVLVAGIPPWLKKLYGVAMVAGVVLLPLQLVAPLGREVLAKVVDVEVVESLVPLHYSTRHLWILAGAAVAGFLVFRSRLRFELRLVGVLAVFHVMILGVNMACREAVEGPEGPVRAFVHQLSPGELERTASYGLNERDRGCFYLYSQRVFPAVNQPRAREILAGDDSTYDRLVCHGDPGDLLPPNGSVAIRASAYLGKRVGKAKDRHFVHLLEPQPGDP